MNGFVFAILFFMPAGIANAIPVFAARLPGNWLMNPMDFGKSMNGTRLIGDNKTWRGLLAGIIIGALVALLLYSLWAQNSIYENWSAGQAIIFGALLGFGALIGDALESFLKRQAGVKPGHTWFPFDQIDYIIGGLLASLFVVRLRPDQYVWILAIWTSLHIVVVYVGYLLGIRRKPI